jgi:hypothetical protein
LPGPLLFSVPVNDASQYHIRAYNEDEIYMMASSGGRLVETWYQRADGVIAPRGREWFKPAYVLGVSRK